MSKTDMKKLLIMLVFLSQAAYSQFEIRPKVGLDYAIGLGTFDFVMHEAYQVYTYDFGNIRAKTALEFRYRNFSAEFDNHIYMRKGARYMFNPLRIDFKAEMAYHMTDKIKLSAGHLCIHPVITIGEALYQFSGGHTVIGISYGY
jgi:hypothetical protein